MSVFSHRSHGRPTAPAHLYSIGQIVRLKSRVGVSSKTAEFFHVTGTLPARDNSLQYRIRNDDERHERVASEDNLEPVATPSLEQDAAHSGRIDWNGQGTEAQQPGNSKAEAAKSPAEG